MSQNVTTSIVAFKKSAYGIGCQLPGERYAVTAGNSQLRGSAHISTAALNKLLDFFMQAGCSVMLHCLADIFECRVAY